MLIHDSWGFYKDGNKSGPGGYSHPTHMHIETKDKGGMIGKGMFMNMGKPEFVLDADSTKSLEDNVPGFLDALNKADYSGALAVLRNYASYETGGSSSYLFRFQQNHLTLHQIQRVLCLHPLEVVEKTGSQILYANGLNRSKR